MAVQFQPTIDGGWVLTCEDVTEQGRAAARIAFLAHHDPLTRLPNRALFAERLEQAVRAAHHSACCAVLYLDLDHFKRINDTQGHAAGDRLLEHVAARLRGCVRESDTVARLGGDEFAVIQTGLERPADASGLASRIIAEIGLPVEIDGQQAMVATSIGIAIAGADGSDGAALLQHADVALYSAKSAGRGCFRFFDAAMAARLEAARQLEMELRRALPRGEFEVFYQPLMQTSSLAILGFEALLRWRHPARGLLSADAFVPALEESGMIVAVGEWVLARACREAAEWPAGLKIAVNLSALQFQGAALVAMVRAAVEAAGLQPRRLELEITETVLLRDSSETVATLHALRALGVAIALDDFGAGYSSLSYLHRFPFDKVKIDRGFVQGLGKNREAIAIVRAVSGLCRDLAVATLAEGVENEAQLAALRVEGCTEVQGYLFSPACPANAIAGLLERFGCVRETI
jgi:diguanylate cyclase (GGDEF)-like protein